VTHCDIGGPDTSGGTPLPKGWRDARFRKAIWEPLHSSVAKKTQRSQLNKKSQNLIDADSELTHVSESSLQVTSLFSA